MRYCLCAAAARIFARTMFTAEPHQPKDAAADLQWLIVTEHSSLLLAMARELFEGLPIVTASDVRSDSRTTAFNC